MKRLLKIFLCLVCTFTFGVSASELKNDWAVTAGLKTSVNSTTSVTSVTSIKFYDTEQTCLGTTYDVGVSLCVNGGDVTFSSNGKITLPSDSSYLFAFFKKATLDFNDSVDFSKVENASNMFDTFASSVRDFTLDLSNLDTSSLTNMYQMFQKVSDNNPKTLVIDLTGFNTSKVTNMSRAFNQAGSLSSSVVIKGLEGFDTKNVTDMSGMFNQFGYANGGIEMDLSNFDTSKVTNMSSMFSYVGAKTLDLSSFNTSNVTDFGSMFKWADKTRYIDISSFDMSKNTADLTAFLYGIEGCEVLVLGDTSVYKEHLVKPLGGSDDWFNANGKEVALEDINSGTYYAYKPYTIKYISGDKVVKTATKAKDFDIKLEYTMDPLEEVITTSFDFEELSPIKSKKVTVYEIKSLDDTYKLGDKYTLNEDLEIELEINEKVSFDTIELPEVSKKDSKFLGWELDGEKLDSKYVANKDALLKPLFEAIVPDTRDKVLESILGGLFLALLLVGMVILVKKTKE